MHQKQDPLITRPEIAAENKKNIICVFYTPYWVLNNNDDAS